MPDNSRTILDLEKRFWQSMVDKDAEAAKAMIADECLVTGPMGAMKIDPQKYAKMTEEGQWTLNSFELSDTEVIFPSDNVAVVAYKVRQKGEMEGKAMDMRCADSSTWVRDRETWKCALHTETVLEGP
ncbi:MAG: nuclear transport factor 2 family protein [Amaricoccus sp.]